MKLVVKQRHSTELLSNYVLIMIVALFFIVTTLTEHKSIHPYCQTIILSEAYVPVATSHTTKYSTNTQQQTYPQTIAVLRNRFVLPSFTTTKISAATGSGNDNDKNDNINNDFDIPLQSNKDNDSIDASRDMVSKFYKEVSDRESGRSSNPPETTSSDDSNRSTTKFTGGSVRSIIPNVYEEQQDIYSVNINTRENAAKMFTSSSSLFDKSNNDRSRNSADGSMSSSSSGSSASSYGMNRQDEFIAVNRFEQTLVVQAIFIVVSLIFVISVGLTGGITDGSDRYNEETDDIDTMLFQYNNIDPSQIIVIPAPASTSSESKISQSSPSSSINDQSLLRQQQQQSSTTTSTTKSAWI